MDPDQRFERRRNFIIAIPTGLLAVILVFAAMGCVSAASDDAKWLIGFVLILPLLVVSSRTSATHLHAALNPPEAPPADPAENHESD